MSGLAAGDGAEHLVLDLREPVLSVIIACLDAAGTLGVQLEALAGQDCPVPWELLICDNGSTDGSLELARSFVPRIPRLRVIDAGVRTGAGPARNVGARQARGRWLAFCDADDAVAPGWLAGMAAALAEHPFVAGRFDPFLLNDARALRSRPLQQDDELQTSPIGPGLPHAGGGNMGIHREVFLELGGFDPAVRWLEDTDLSWRAQLAGVPLTFRPELVVSVRLRSTYRSMARQGWQYGRAHALLESRYGGSGASASAAVPAASASVTPITPVTSGTAVASGPTGAGSSPAAAAVAAVWRRRHRVRALASARTWADLVSGRLLWQLGWSVGYHRYKGRPVETVDGLTQRPAVA